MAKSGRIRGALIKNFMQQKYPYLLLKSILEILLVSRLSNYRARCVLEIVPDVACVLCDG